MSKVFGYTFNSHAKGEEPMLNEANLTFTKLLNRVKFRFLEYYVRVVIRLAMTGKTVRLKKMNLFVLIFT